ncbi:MAG: sodium/glutamate symporter [Planctomycetota bacterium]
MPDAFMHAILLACGLLLIGFALRAGVGLLRVLYVPAAVVGGVVGLGLIQGLLRVDAIAGFATEVSGVLSKWPGFLISVVFAGLLLERSSKSLADTAVGTAKQGVVAWLIILGQVTVGLLTVLLVLKPLGLLDADVPGSFGQLIETGFAGGHGTAAAMGEVFASLDFTAGRDLGFFFATYGLIYGTLSGIVLVNIGVRAGWLAQRSGETADLQTADLQTAADTGLEPRRAPKPVAFGRVGGQVIDPFVFQVLIVGAALGVGYGLQQLFLAATGLVATERAMGFIDNIPLFLFALVGGWIVREVLHAMKLGDLIDPPSVQRIIGFAMEFLIVAAIASLRVEAIATYFAPAVVLLIVGSLWAIVGLVVIGRWLLPRDYWFELGLINYGMSTATTAQGMLLLRIVDRDLDTPAAETYAAAAPLTAPFIGGGILTVAGFPALIAYVGLAATAGICLAGMAMLLVMGYFLRNR